MKELPLDSNRGIISRGSPSSSHSANSLFDSMSVSPPPISIPPLPTRTHTPGPSHRRVPFVLVPKFPDNVTRRDYKPFSSLRTIFQSTPISPTRKRHKSKKLRDSSPSESVVHHQSLDVALNSALKSNNANDVNIRPTKKSRLTQSSTSTSRPAEITMYKNSDKLFSKRINGQEASQTPSASRSVNTSRSHPHVDFGDENAVERKFQPVKYNSKTDKSTLFLGMESQTPPQALELNTRFLRRTPSLASGGNQAGLVNNEGRGKGWQNQHADSWLSWSWGGFGFGRASEELQDLGLNDKDAPCLITGSGWDGITLDSDEDIYNGTKILHRTKQKVHSHVWRFLLNIDQNLLSLVTRSLSTL